MLKRMTINNCHWPGTRRPWCGKTAADEAKVVPVISPPGCPLATSEACHWSPDCDVTCWREKNNTGSVKKGRKLPVESRTVSLPIITQHRNFSSHQLNTVQKKRWTTSVGSAAFGRKSKQFPINNEGREFCSSALARIHIVVATLMTSSPCNLLNLVSVDVHFPVHSVRREHQISQYGSVRSVFSTEDRLKKKNTSTQFRCHR